MKNKKIFWRTVFISGMIFFNLLLLSAGVSTAYENIREISHGEYKSAIEINQDNIRFLDFEIKKFF